jgi:hypothetical protein
MRPSYCLWFLPDLHNSRPLFCLEKKRAPPPNNINTVQLPQEEDIKYLGLHLDRRLTWHKHTFVKHKQLGITFTKMCFLLGHKSKLSTSNKILIYKTKFKPIWTYGIQLWGTASTSNIQILERLVCDSGRTWYVPNTVIRRDLQIPTVKKSAATALNTVRASAYIKMT